VKVDMNRALQQREANAAAYASGEPLPFPNIWDALDPTKVHPDATAAEIRASHREFDRLCRRRPRKRHVL
jgi:hypothetical protein